eukprot:jgi/Ulvmu1/26/UM001_0027.1
MLKVISVFAGLQLVSTQVFAQTLTFSADAAVSIDVSATGEPGSEAGAENTAAVEVSGGSVVDIMGVAQVSTSGSLSISTPLAPDLERQDLIPVGAYIRTCDCTKVNTVFVDDIRDISNEFCADGNAKSAAGLSNMVWGFGQFLDHDLALSIENEHTPTIAVETETDVMDLHRAITSNRRGCKNTLNVHTPHVDAGPVYGTDEELS